MPIGAGRGGRTPTRLPSADFESAASASSAIPALRLVNHLPAAMRLVSHAGWTGWGKLSLHLALSQYRIADARVPAAESSLALERDLARSNPETT